MILVWANQPPAQAFESVDWSLLIFFAGLFVVVDGVVQVEGRWVARLLAAAAARPETLPGMGPAAG